MGFRLGSFLAGMAEGAVEIEENARKRNEKIIDTALERHMTIEEESRRKRESSQEEYDKLAKLLSSLPGMSEEKVYAVLDHGPEVASYFFETAPKRAADEGLTVGDYVEIMDHDALKAGGFNLNKAMQQNRLPGMPAARKFDPKVIGLQESPIFKRTGEGYAESQASAVNIGVDETASEDMYLPSGSIKFMDLLEKDKVKAPLLSPTGVISEFTAHFLREQNVDFKRDSRTGAIVVADENLAKKNQAEQDAFDTFGIYNGLITNEDGYDLDTQQYDAMQEALRRAANASDQNLNISVGNNSQSSTNSTSQATPSTQQQSTPAPAQPTPQSAIVSVPIVVNGNNIGSLSFSGGVNGKIMMNGAPTSPAKIATAIRQANPGMSPAQVTGLAKKLLDELKAKVK